MKIMAEKGVFRIGMLLIATALASFLMAPVPASASSRIKDIVSFEGVRENQLIGYGLVVGLNGTGDTLQNAPFTRQSIVAMLERMGVNTRASAAQMRTENVAAVMVTAELPAFSRPGSRVDVTVSSMGDAEDLRGGSLLVTPLLGADGEVYAVAQGSLAVAGFTAGGDAESLTQGVPTAARIANGAIIEREIQFELNGMASIRLSLNNPDFTTSRRIAMAINGQMGMDLARPLDSSTVLVVRPTGSVRELVDLVTDIELVRVETDQRARVVIDDRSGIIVMGSEVRISEIAIAQGNLTIRITENPQVSQPGPFSEGETVVVPDTTIEVNDSGDQRLRIMSQGGISLQELVDGLNALGVGPRDMIAILQAMKVAGAMQADIEVM
jgi:flagellar P-ring protein FlgI